MDSFSAFQQRSEPAQDRTRRRVRMTDLVMKALVSYGYMEIDFPMCEYYDLLKDTAYDFSDENIIRFVDRNTGKTLVLRPDFTPQACRAVTGYMASYPYPLRVCYRGEIFRSEGSYRGRGTERYQIGWELFGGEEFCGDLEMFLSARRAFKNVGLRDYKFIVGDSMFLNRIFFLAGDMAALLKEAVAAKRSHEVKRLLTRSAVNANLSSIISGLSVAFGGEEVLNSLKAAVSFDKVLLSRAEYMSQLFTTLKRMGFDEETLVFDASETKGLDYYTGVNFDIVRVGAGFPLGGGGRYDKLMDKFGKTLSACGMALHVEELMNSGVCADDGQHFDYLAVGWANMEKAERLRDSGASVLFTASGAQREKFIKTYRFKNILE